MTGKILNKLINISYSHATQWFASAYWLKKIQVFTNWCMSCHDYGRIEVIMACRYHFTAESKQVLL